MTPIEVFSVGTWGGETWTERDLDEMVANHARLKEHVKPPLKLGHAQKQVLAQTDGQPALGWVASLQRVGAKLVALVEDMPEALQQAVAAKRWKRVSSEIYRHWERTPWEANLKSGVTGNVLSAVALMGADIPEVKNLDDLRLLASEAAAFFAEDVQPEPLALAPAPPTPTLVADAEKETRMADDVKALRDQLAAAEQAAAQQAAANAASLKTMSEQSAAELTAMREKAAADLKALHERIETLQAKDAERELRLQIAEADQFLEAHKDRVTPALKPVLRVLLTQVAPIPAVKADSEAAKAIFGETPRDADARELVRVLVTKLPKSVLMGERGLASADHGVTTVDQFADAVKQMAEQHGIDLTDPAGHQKATNLVIQQKPELVPDYRTGRA